MKRLENRQAVLQACQQIRQTPEDQRLALTVSLSLTFRHLREDNALLTTAEDAFYFGLFSEEKKGALERLAALIGDQSAFAESKILVPA